MPTQRQSPLDMANRLKQPSLRKIGAEVAHLNNVPVPQPLTLKELMKLFANVAMPKIPGITDIYPYGRVDWKDLGAGTYRYATQYHAKIQMNVDGEWLPAWDGWTNQLAWAPQNQLAYDTDWRVAVVGWNEWGHSDVRWSEFSSGDNPNPPPPPDPGPQPHVQHPSEIWFYNCDNTPVVDPPHLPVLFHLRNVTANGGWQSWNVDPGYFTSPSGGCGDGLSTPLMFPSADTIQLTPGDTYQWIVTKPDDPDCSDSSTAPDDPNHCPVLGPGTVIIGTDARLVIQWPPG